LLGGCGSSTYAVTQTCRPARPLPCRAGLSASRSVMASGASLAPNGCMSPTGQPSAENSGKPLTGRGCAPRSPLGGGGLTALLRLPSWWGGGRCCRLPKNPPPPPAPPTKNAGHALAQHYVLTRRARLWVHDSDTAAPTYGEARWMRQTVHNHHSVTHISISRLYHMRALNATGTKCQMWLLNQATSPRT